MTKEEIHKQYLNSLEGCDEFEYDRWKECAEDAYIATMDAMEAYSCARNSELEAEVGKRKVEIVARQLFP